MLIWIFSLKIMKNLTECQTEQIKEFIRLSQKQIENLTYRMQASHFTTNTIEKLTHLKLEYLMDIDRYEHELRRRECLTEIPRFYGKY